jgi:hypothetical protein
MSVATIAITLAQAIVERLNADDELQALLPGGVYLEPLSPRSAPKAFDSQGRIRPSGVVAVEAPAMALSGLGRQRVTLTTYAWRGGGADPAPYPPTPSTPPRADPLVLACRRAIVLLDSMWGGAALQYATRSTHLFHGRVDGDQADDPRLPARVVRCAFTAPVLLIAGATGG